MTHRDLLFLSLKEKFPHMVVLYSSHEFYKMSLDKVWTMAGAFTYKTHGHPLTSTHTEFYKKYKRKPFGAYYITYRNNKILMYFMYDNQEDALIFKLKYG